MSSNIRFVRWEKKLVDLPNLPVTFFYDWIGTDNVPNLWPCSRPAWRKPGSARDRGQGQMTPDDREGSLYSLADVSMVETPASFILEDPSLSIYLLQ